MKFLIDNQLPHGLVNYFQSHGIQSSHVIQHNLDEATDHEIWAFAREYGWTIITKDEDFFHLATLMPEGPAVVWVRLGNCRKPELFQALDGLLPEIMECLSKGSKLVEVR